MSEPTTIDLGAMYQRLAQEWRTAQLREAELRGQVQLLEQLLAQVRQPPSVAAAPPTWERDPRDIQESRLGEAHQGLDIVEESSNQLSAISMPVSG